MLLGLCLAAGVVAGGCEGAGSGASTPRSGPGPASTSKTIPQPRRDKLNKLTRRRLAPEGRRVDLAVPSFTDPTTITNPLFPISRLRSAVLVGKLNGDPWRAETTLLPETKVVDWNGQHIEALQSQFIAYLNGRIFEVAVDLYAQADDGSVWYLGEDAFTYKRGRPFDTEGTWRAGVNGPPAMIMPGHPRVGDVYRTENIPGVVFEQVTVKRVNQTVSGPSGKVAGVMVAQELHMDEKRLEEKTFAPGYGEFFSGGGRTFEATALAVPADALSGPDPAALETLSRGADDVLVALRSQGWKAASAGLDKINAAWDTLRASGVPKRLGARLDTDLVALGPAIAARDSRAAAVMAIDVANASLDLQLRYRPSVEVDLARVGLWTRQLQADAAAGDSSALIGDVATLDWIRDRIRLESSDAGLIDDQIRYLQAAAQAGELTAAADAAARLRAMLADVHPTP